MSDLKPGDFIAGEYHIQRVFGGQGKSGMGVVYLVQDRDAPWPFILKTYQHKRGSNNEQQFIAEAHAWINAGAHQNIVQAYWVREIDGQIYIAAEYISPDEEGRNTLTHFLNIGLLKIEVVLQWAAQFCYGMDYARANGVLVHRDIKPDNIMIDQNGTLKITDFGLAKSMDIDEAKPQKGWWPFGSKKKLIHETASKTKTGSVMGTYPYMAPEQFSDAKSVDHRADIYSFGIILYLMVTGNKYPYRINNNLPDIGKEYFRMHAQEKPLAVDSPLMSIITKCLEKKAGFRYRDYDDLLNDLKALGKRLNINIPSQVHVSKEDEALYAKAQSYVALGDSNKALAFIDEYTKSYPENACGWTEKGRIHLERGENAQALAATRKSLEVNPYNTHAWNNLGIALNRSSTPITEIKKAYTKALYFDPYNTAAMMNLAGLLALHKEYAEAAALTGKALKLRPDKPLTLLKANALIKDIIDEKHFAIAETLLTEWTEARPADTDAWLNLGLMFFNRRYLNGATQCFKQVLKLKPNDIETLELLAQTLVDIGRLDEALPYLDKALVFEPQFVAAWITKGNVLDMLGRSEDAIDCYDKVLAIDSRATSALGNKCIALGAMGRNEEALSCADKWLQIDPRDVKAWFTKGCALGKLKRYQDALVCYQEAQKLGDPSATKFVDRCRLNLGL